MTEQAEKLHPVYAYHAIECEAFSKILNHLVVTRMAAGMNDDARRICQIMIHAEHIARELRSEGGAVVMMTESRLDELKRIIAWLEKFQQSAGAEPSNQ